jgi:long-subunit acyl-CoA synthetase (AMP-forming)
LAGTKIFISDGLKKFPEIFKFSQENKLSGLSLVPSGLELIKFLLKNKANLFAKKLNYIEIGSSHISKEVRIWLKKNFSKTNIIHHYGMTEASRSFLLPRGKSDDLKKNINLIGKIIPGCKYKIDKTNSELLLKGKNLFEGYFDQENNRFIDGWFRTRDIVKKKLNELYLVGRADNQFNIGGNKIQAEMIEDLIEDINHVKRCVCFTQPDKIYGNSLALIV